VIKNRFLIAAFIPEGNAFLFLNAKTPRREGRKETLFVLSNFSLCAHCVFALKGGKPLLQEKISNREVRKDREEC
jgi:hypothetical protein